MQHMFLNGEDVTAEIRRNEVSACASKAASIPAVRGFLLEMQRRIAQENSVIMDGRDIGTVVLPQADLKIFLTAAPEERAQRRWKELLERGQRVELDQVLAEVMERDRRDSERETSPLRRAEDAVLADTTGLDPEERIRFRNLLCEIAKDRVVLLSTHIVGDIEATCENIAVLNQGKVCFQGKVAELLSSVEGKVYSAEIPAEELERVKENHMVTGILTTGSTANVKIIAETKPFPQARPVQPDVEDAYMYLMNS